MPLGIHPRISAPPPTTFHQKSDLTDDEIEIHKVLLRDFLEDRFFLVF